MALACDAVVPPSAEPPYTRYEVWSASGSKDTEFGVLMEPKVESGSFGLRGVFNARRLSICSF